MYIISLTDNHGNSKSWMLDDGAVKDAEYPIIFKFTTDSIGDVVDVMMRRTARFVARPATMKNTDPVQHDE
jgi:hypothetical protein